MQIITEAQCFERLGFMLKQQGRPEYHFVRNTGDLSCSEIAGLSDEELAAYIKTLKKFYQINPAYIMREIGGEYAIIPVDEECLISNAVMTPNASAVFIWNAFLTPSLIEDVVRKALQEFDGPGEVIRDDIYRFVKETLVYKIIREVK